MTAMTAMVNAEQSMMNAQPIRRSAFCTEKALRLDARHLEGSAGGGSSVHEALLAARP